MLQTKARFDAISLLLLQLSPFMVYGEEAQGVVDVEYHSTKPQTTPLATATERPEAHCLGGPVVAAAAATGASASALDSLTSCNGSSDSTVVNNQGLFARVVGVAAAAASAVKKGVERIYPDAWCWKLNKWPTEPSKNGMEGTKGCEMSMGGPGFL